jgi:putative transposase
VVLFLKRQRLVLDKPARARELAHLARLLAGRHEFELEGLKEFHAAYHALAFETPQGEVMGRPRIKDPEMRHGRHRVFLMHVHLVFVTKYRRGVFTKQIIDDLRMIFANVCRDFESDLVALDGEDNHVHLMVNYPPKVAVSALVNSLKGVSSRMIWQKNYPSIRRKLWGGALWSPSYFAGSCGGAPIAIVRQYIEQQQTPH